MLKKSCGQEAVEFVLISIVVFFASLFVLLVFGEQIAAFFQNNPAATDKEIAVYSETDGLQTTVNTGSNSSGSGIEVTLPLGSGDSIDITIPDTTDYIDTTGSSGGTISALAELVDVYGNLIDDIASEEGANANLARLAEVIKSIGDLQSQLYPTYQVDEENQKRWLTDLDPADAGSLAVVNEFLDSLAVTFDQMQDVNSTDLAYTNAFIGTEDPVTNPATYDQIAYAKELQDAFQAVSEDSTISAAIKDTVALMVDQVSDISNNTSYVIDNDLYTSSLADLAAIKTSVDLRTIEEPSLALTPSLVITDTVPLPVETVDVKVAYIQDLCLTINSDPVLLANITTEQRETLVDLAKTINIQINQPPESILNMDLAGQVACIADPVSCSSP